MGSFIQEMMQGRVLPGQVIPVRQFFKPVQIPFAQLFSGLLVGRITKIDSTAERPLLPSRTKVLALKWAKFGRDRCLVGRRVGEQHVGFQAAKKQRVAVFLESATSPTGDAYRARGAYLGID